MKQKEINKKVNKLKSRDIKQQEIVLFKSFERFVEKNSIFILLALISIIVFFVFKDFIFLNKTYLFKDIGSDSINIYYPTFYSLADYVFKEGMPRWSFNQGMGQNIFPCEYFDPFSIFIILMGKNNVYFTMFFAEAFKIFFAGLFFYLFLKKIINSNYTAILGGVLYSFTGFIILGGQWIGFSTEAVYIAFLLFSFEKLYQDNNWILFPVSIFLISANNTIGLYIIGLFLLIYIVFRLFEANERKQKKIFILLTKVICLGITGILMSSFFLINSVQIMLDSPRGSGESSYTGMLMSRPIFGLEGEEKGGFHYLTALMRFFSCDMLGTGSNYKGWHNYLEAPLFYCGLISLVILPHLLSLSSIRKKIIYFIFLIIFIFPVIFPFFRYAFWLFTGNYYRTFSFFVALTILLISLKSINNIDYSSKTSFIIICTTLLLLLCFLYYPYTNAQIIDKKLRIIVTIFLIIYSVLIYLIQFKTIKNIVKLLLLLVIVVELIYFSSITVNKRPVITGAETKQKVGYNDFTVDAIKYLKSVDKTFFRIIKKYSSGTSNYGSKNDAKVQDFFGTSSYSSFNQLNYIKFLVEMKFIDIKKEIKTRWVDGLIECIGVHSFASVKYSLNKANIPLSGLSKFYYVYFKTIGDVIILKNKFPLPLGFTYDKYINLKDFKKLSQIQKLMVLYRAFVVDSTNIEKTRYLSEFEITDTLKSYSFDVLGKYIASLKEDSLVINKFSQNNIKGEIKLNRKKMLFFSIPFDRGWSAKVDGKTETPLIINIGFIGLLLDKGEHSIELSFLPPYYYTGAYISLISVFLFILILVIKNFNKKKITTQ